MKISRLGVAIMILFLVLIPLLMDTILKLVTGKKGLANMQLSTGLINAYIVIIPIYIAYLVLAFGVMKWWKKWKNRER